MLYVDIFLIFIGIGIGILLIYILMDIGKMRKIKKYMKEWRIKMDMQIFKDLLRRSIDTKDKLDIVRLLGFNIWDDFKKEIEENKENILKDFLSWLIITYHMI